MTSELGAFHPAVRDWFLSAFPAATQAQTQAWPSILEGQSTLLLAPTGSGKTLAAFLVALERLMFGGNREAKGTRVLYISPLKALGVDVERNLRGPLSGVEAAAGRSGLAFHRPSIGVRTGDTTTRERAQLLRHPPDILITTPESLYLMLTSRARDSLASVDTVIVDEIHSLVPSKRGVHLFLSLERLESLRGADAPPLQRIGLSATQRPLEEVARLLGGGRIEGEAWIPRPVRIIDAGAKKELELRIEVTVEDMAALGGGGAAETSEEPEVASIWPSIHARLVELIRFHRSTMLFVNSRRLAERLTDAINELAGEELALAHHGSVSKERRREIEDQLKRGALPAIVATSSMELGIDMGAVDLVIQVESPPSVASGLQRIGRGNHHVGGTSHGVFFPKFRGDLLATAACVSAMRQGEVEETFYPRNALDVLAQQIVAMAAVSPTSADEVYETVRRAAPYAELHRASFDGVLDMLSGLYPSEEFAELRARITWDRISGHIEARRGAQRIAVTNAGTIPDRGLFGVFLEGGDDRRSRRVGELDEEMVFETQVGDVFLLGASSWRVTEITHDRVLVVPAPGQAGRMPFWRGDQPGRPAAFGRRIGKLARELAEVEGPEAAERFGGAHGLDGRGVENLRRYVDEQRSATGEVPSDRSIVVERFVDEIGDHRVVVLSPFGGRVHAGWGTAVLSQLQAESAGDVDLVWSDDGMVFRIPETDEPPSAELFFPHSSEVEDLIVSHLSSTALFAGRFRENAARALLLPRKHPAKRSPLWAQRKRASDLLGVAAKFREFPIILETYRECLRDVFDVPALIEVLRSVEAQTIRVFTVDTKRPSPFAASLLFDYIANFVYNGDAPLAERRAQVLSLDHSQLRALLGESELRLLFAPELISALESRLQRTAEGLRVRHPDHLHDLLLSIGDLRAEEIEARTEPPADAPAMIRGLVAARRILEVRIAGESRLIAAEDAGRYRDALGVMPPDGVPSAFLTPVPDALHQLAARYARSHAPFPLADLARRFGLGLAAVELVARPLIDSGRWIRAEMLPGGIGLEVADAEVLRSLKQRALAHLRQEVAPVPQVALARFLPAWQGLLKPATGLDAVLDAVERMQGAAIPASVLETDVLPARVKGYQSHWLDELLAAGEILWRGLGSLGPTHGRVALYLADHYPKLGTPMPRVEGELAGVLRAELSSRGGLFFRDLLQRTRSFGPDLEQTLWDLVFGGELTNDTFSPVRTRVASLTRKTQIRASRFRSRRTEPPGTEGRWSLLPDVDVGGPSPTERSLCLARQLLERHGVLTREAVHAEGTPGGFAALYPVLKSMEEASKVRRGYFVEGLGATQFALLGAVERLREQRDPIEDETALVLAATDPAQPYGAALPWPSREGAKPQRSAGAQVVLLRGELLAYLGRSEKSLLSFLPAHEPERSHAARVLAETLVRLVSAGGRRALLIHQIDGAPPESSELAAQFERAGFSLQSRGLFARRASRSS